MLLEKVRRRLLSLHLCLNKTKKLKNRRRSIERRYFLSGQAVERCGLLFHELDSFSRMEPVAGGAIASHAAFRTMAGDAGCFGRQQNILGSLALAGFVAMSAIDGQVFRVIESSARQPAVGNLWLDDFGNHCTARLDLVAKSATGIKRTAIKRFPFGAKKNFTLQIFTGSRFLLQGAHLVAHKVFQFALFGLAILPAEIGVLNFQTAQEVTRRFGISVGQLQFRISFVELE